jgi:superfamily II DNA/RNA helicase
LSEARNRNREREEIRIASLERFRYFFNVMPAFQSDNNSPLEFFHPVVRRWFSETFGEPSPPQRAGWPPIMRGEHTLLLAPTGSGKTLAAFLWAINHLFERSCQW